MELIIIAVLSVLLPIFTIAGFIIGYNINAPRKVLAIKKKEKHEKTEDEIMLERIDNAKV